jgi:hypothetical protein
MRLTDSRAITLQARVEPTRRWESVSVSTPPGAAPAGQQVQHKSTATTLRNIDAGRASKCSDKHDRSSTQRSRRVRDEEVAGSNPVTPTVKCLVRVTLRFSTAECSAERKTVLTSLIVRGDATAQLSAPW